MESERLRSKPSELWVFRCSEFFLLHLSLSLSAPVIPYSLGTHDVTGRAVAVSPVLCGLASRQTSACVYLRVSAPSSSRRPPWQPPWQWQLPSRSSRPWVPRGPSLRCHWPRRAQPPRPPELWLSPRSVCPPVSKPASFSLSLSILFLSSSERLLDPSSFPG